MEGPSHDKATGDKSNGLKWASSVAGALGQLLAWSLDAKAAALDAGLLPAILQELDELSCFGLDAKRNNLSYSMVHKLQRDKVAAAIHASWDQLQEWATDVPGVSLHWT